MVPSTLCLQTDGFVEDKTVQLMLTTGVVTVVFSILVYFIYMGACVYVFAHCVQCLKKPEEGVRAPGTPGDFELPCRCCDLDLGLLEES